MSVEVGDRDLAMKSGLTPDHCEITACFWPHKIQRHRINPGRDGGKYKLGNVIALCPNHHWMADNALLTQEQLFEIVDRRIAAMTDEELDGRDTAVRMPPGADESERQEA